MPSDQPDDDDYGCTEPCHPDAQCPICAPGISPKWSELATGWLGVASGRHCHWCKHIVHDDGESTCGNDKGKFYDGDRIRTWDGVDCAAECECFELSEYYTDDKNLEKP